MRRFCLSLVILLVAFVAPLWAQATDIDWIGSLPGFSLRTRTTSEGKITRLYSVSDAAAAYAAVQNGLKSRSWSVSKNSEVTTGATYVGSLKATKGASLLKVTSTSIPGMGGTVTVVLTGGSSEAQTGNTQVSTGGESQVSSLTVNDSHTKGTYNVNGEVVVNASHCNLTIKGNCRELVINSSHCTFTVLGRIGSVVFNGPHNKVTWSRQGNGGRAPSVQDNASHNSISAR